MFWSNERDEEQKQRAEAIKQQEQRNRATSNALEELQKQAGEVIGAMLEAKGADKEERREKARALRRKKQDIREHVERAERDIAEGEQQPDEDLEELSAEQQAQAREKARKELEEAQRRIRDLEQQLEEADDDPDDLAVGGTAWVRKAGGQGLNRRDAPGINSNVHDSLAIGTQLTVLEGPARADGYTWWRVRASDGREGWVAGEELVTQPE